METFKINYKSDFVLRLASDAGWGTAFTLEFWSNGAPTKRYYATHDGNGNYTNCKPDSDTELRVMFDDHGLGIGNLMLRITYSLADKEFRTGKDDEVVNVTAITVLNDEGEEVNVMLNLEGETAAGVQFSLPLLEAEKKRQNAEAQRNINETQRIAAEQQRQLAETLRKQAELDRQASEDVRKSNESTREAAEQQRQTAEAARAAEFKTNEAARKETFETNEAERQATFEANEAKRQVLYEKVAKNTDGIELLNTNTGVSEYPEFSEATAYAVGNVVIFEGKMYRFTSAHAAGAWDASQVVAWSERKEVDEKLKELEGEVLSINGGTQDVKDELKVGGYYNGSNDFIEDQWGKYTEKISIANVNKIIIKGDFEGAYRTLIYDEDDNVVLNLNEVDFKEQPYELIVQDGWNKIAFSFYVNDDISGILLSFSGELPQLKASINSINENLDSLNNIIKGQYQYITVEGKLNEYGAIEEDKSFFTSDFIEAVGGKTYTHHTNTEAIVNFVCYDENKNYIDRWSVKTSRAVTIPSNAKYIRATFAYPKDSSNFILCEEEEIFNASYFDNGIMQDLEKEIARAISRENDIENGIQPKIDAKIDATLEGKPTQVEPIFESGAYNSDGSTNSITWAKKTDRIDIKGVKDITLEGEYMGAPSLYTIFYKDNVIVRTINENQFLNNTPYVIDTTDYDEVAFSFHSGSSPIIKFTNTGIQEDIDLLKSMFGDFAPRVIPNTFSYPIGKDITIYKKSIVLNDNEQGISNGKSQYRDRIVIGESSAKKVQYGYFVLDKDNAKVNELPFSVDYMEQKNTAMKVLLLGDSTIDTLVGGVPVASGRIVHYLKDLYPNIILIGDRGAAPYVHSGHGGWRATDYADKPYRGTDTTDVNPFFNPETNTFDFGYYISTKNLQAPDVVVIQLGINDVSASTSPDYGDKNVSSYISSMKKIISSIHHYNSNIKVYVHLIFPPSSSWEHHEAYHDSSLSPNIMKRYNILASAKAIKELDDVSVMPTNAILNADTDFADRVHPNSGGYEKVAKFIADYLSVL